MIVSLHRSCSLAVAVTLGLSLLDGCGGTVATASSQDDVTADASLVIRGKLAPQSFVHDSVSDRVPKVSFSFSGKAGDLVAPDVWPTDTGTSNSLQPVLALLGPAVGGKRSVIASGTPRGSDPRHLAIDGFKLPKTGSYVVQVGQAGSGKGGSFTLRLWTSASHAPRPETAQLDLSLKMSAQMKQLLDGHSAGAGQAAARWSDAEVDAGISYLFGASDALVGFSDAEQLLVTLTLANRDTLASAAQLTRAQKAAATLVGTPAAFQQASFQQQAFALYWLGLLSSTIFEVREVTAPSALPAQKLLAGQLDSLITSWPGAVEVPSDRRIHEISLGGTVYGYVAAWSCAQPDLNGTPVFAWYSTDYFGAGGDWLGEQSAGASEPEDD